MKRTLLICGAAACVLLEACSAAPVIQIPLQRQPLSQGQAVIIDIDSGNLDLSGVDSGAVEISGQRPQDETWQVTSEADGIHIISKTKSRPFWEQGASPARIKLRVPNRTRVNINGFDADMLIHDFSGNVTISEVSGDIRVLNSEGNFEIQSNRGNVSAEATSGAVHLAGNYGVLSMVNARGNLGASTIMGTVRFAGAIRAGDEVSLETDHGPVEIQLGAASDVTVQVGTTSGVVTCTMPGIHYEGQACTGALQAGRGQLKVRTVSGSATLTEMP